MHCRPFHARVAAAFAAACVLTTPAQAAVITFDTTALTIDGVAGGGAFRGTGFTTAVRAGDGAAVFVFHGDLDLAGDEVRFVGNRGVSLQVMNDARLAGAVFDASAQGSSGSGAGGGWGGAGGAITPAGQRGAFGGRSDIAPIGGSGGDGGSPCFFDCPEGQNGTRGLPAYGAFIAATAGGAGLPGSAGGFGFNNPASAGDGGAGGRGGQAPNGVQAGPGGGAGGLGGGQPGNETSASGDDGLPGQPGAKGFQGRTGGTGGVGGGGSAGLNAASGFAALVGGGAGGGGGSGGVGGGGEGGTSGSGGGGGGGEEGEVGSSGEHGGAGGAGNRGGDGGRGGFGGVGGVGGGGGGAVELVARGRVDATGARLLARGGTPAASAPGYNGNAGAAGLPGLDGNPGVGGGGAGGRGGDGGTGGTGGTGGAGGTGGGGAGGTLRLVGSVVASSGTLLDASGGNGATVGDDGWLVYGANSAAGYAGGHDGRFGEFLGHAETGLGDANPYLLGATATHTGYIPGLAGGAELFGLLDGMDALAADFDALRAAAPAGAVAALYRMGTGPAGYADDFLGFDLLVLVNLLDSALTDPYLGVDPAGLDHHSTLPLMLGGYLRDAPEVLGALGPHALWATLIPEQGTTFNFRVTEGVFLGGASLEVGGFAFVGAVPVPGGIVLLASALAWLGLARRRPMRRAASR
ncbi:MAG: hypothetical protein AB7Q81_01010 [Gammaproteobacteria bacterium]